MWIVNDGLLTCVQWRATDFERACLLAAIAALNHVGSSSDLGVEVLKLYSGLEIAVAGTVGIAYRCDGVHRLSDSSVHGCVMENVNDDR